VGEPTPIITDLDTLRQILHKSITGLVQYADVEIRVADAAKDTEAVQRLVVAKTVAVTLIQNLCTECRVSGPTLLDDIRLIEQHLIKPATFRTKRT